MLRRFRQWKHSLSASLGAGSVICTIISAIVEHGTWWYDFWLGFGGDLGGATLFVMAARYLWEERAEQSRPPEQK